MGTDIWVWPFSWIRMENREVEVVAAAAGTIIHEFEEQVPLILPNNCIQEPSICTVLRARF